MTHTTSTPANPAQGVSEAWLVTSGPDGQCAKVVIGFDSLKREVVAAVFGDGNDDSEEAQDMRDRLDAPGDWEGDRWSISWSFEDGYLNVQRITDLPAITAAIGAGGQAVAEDAGAKLARAMWGVDLVSSARSPTHPAPSGQAVVVKALEWEKPGKVFWKAVTHYGTYGIERQTDEIGHTFWCWFKPGGYSSAETITGYNSTLAAAKQSAQDKHNALALSALSHPSAQQGWRMVPEEPTEAMLDAYWHQCGESKEMRSRTHAYGKRYYQAMLRAAPLPNAESTEKGGEA